ncbi:MAG: hypothetical protein WA801_04755, partial [Pseudolabrys sp.]
TAAMDDLEGRRDVKSDQRPGQFEHTALRRHALHAATFPYKDAVRRNVCFPQIAESNRNIRGPF